MLRMRLNHMATILTSEPYGHEASEDKPKELERNSDPIFGYSKCQCLHRQVRRNHGAEEDPHGIVEVIRVLRTRYKIL